MIHRIRVQNFKSLEDTAVDLGDVTVLVGRSGTGKTNFVKALGFLRDYLYFGQPQDPELQNWKRLLPATKQKCQMSFELEFDVKGIQDSFTYCVTLHQAGPGGPVTRESLRLGDETFFAQADGKWEVEPQLVSVPQPGPPAIGRIPSISEVVIAYTALTSAIGCYDFPATVLGGVDQGAKKPTISGLNDDAGNYLQTLKEIVSNLQDLNVRKSITATLQRLNPSVSAVELDSIQQPKNVVVGHKFDEKTLTLTLAQESGGFRRFYAHLLALYQLPPKQTLVFEEPENGIYPGALELLAHEFKAAPSAGRGQVILTTHSPSLLDHFSADQIRVVVLDGFQTRIGRISPEQREAVKEQLTEAGELLTVDPARIEDTETADA
ncbi:MAG: AAA family ATPase [Planctomycetota bacterium]